MTEIPDLREIQQMLDRLKELQAENRRLKAERNRLMRMLREQEAE
jgi:hypothetical protein